MDTSVNPRGPVPDLACIDLSDTLLEIAACEASQLLKSVLGGAHAPHNLLNGSHVRACNIDPMAEALALFNANWRNGIE